MNLRPRWIFRFQMHRVLKLLFAILIALPSGAVFAQATTSIVVTIKSDGTCHTVELTVPCRDIGQRLRTAGISSDTLVQFVGDAHVSFEVIRSAMVSASQAGFRNAKIGFAATPTT
jgi:biopolymer transport protein ExbD